MIMDKKTIGDVFNTLNNEQRICFYAIIGMMEDIVCPECSKRIDDYIESIHSQEKR